MVIVGAGVAGLALARKLRASGVTPVVLERARGVGGRCATRRIEGQRVDHGLGFLHGASPEFRAELDALAGSATVLDWPRVRDGAGVPCAPAAFDAGQRQVAIVDGISRFAKHLAQGTDVRLNAEVTALAWSKLWEVRLATGETLRTACLVLTLPVRSAVRLLTSMNRVPQEIEATLPVLDLVHHLPCLTVIARYPADRVLPSWDVSYPDGASPIQTILNESRKRRPGGTPVLVVQARARYSREHLDEPPESWSRELLAAAAAVHGEWVLEPELVQAHVWRSARVASGSALARPLVASLGDGSSALGIAGDGMHAASGVEGAFLSGLALAARLDSALSLPASR